MAQLAWSHSAECVPNADALRLHGVPVAQRRQQLFADAVAVTVARRVEGLQKTSVEDVIRQWPLALGEEVLQFAVQYAAAATAGVSAPSSS